jgi:hypothetical protein
MRRDSIQGLEWGSRVRMKLQSLFEKRFGSYSRPSTCSALETDSLVSVTGKVI